MTRLSSEQVLKDNTTSDPNSVSSLKLTYKALSDVRCRSVLFSICFNLSLSKTTELFLLKPLTWQVSCLSGFKNLERLDLTFNNLTSLEVYLSTTLLYIYAFFCNMYVRLSLMWFWDDDKSGVESMRQLEVVGSCAKQTGKLKRN